MNFTQKIKNSLWVIFSFILLINGFGFIYIGFKHSNKSWILEGITYELPWLAYFIVFGMFDNSPTSLSYPSMAMIILGLIFLFISIIRSIWVAVKLNDVYENNEKYTINTTELKAEKVDEGENNLLGNCGCCLCVFAVFALFAMMAM